MKQSTVTVTETIKKGKEFLRANFEKGIECPCCAQLVKMYKRPFNSGMAYSLILIYKLSVKNNFSWIQAQDELTKEYNVIAINLEYPKLAYWGLLEQKEGVREDGSKNNGYWKITQKGIDFVLGLSTIKKKVHIYNTKIYGYSGENINIQESLKEKFNYSELMNG